jgi:uncharacterized protein YeaO (DUF488 family)
MKIYTSYFGNYKNIPPNYQCISIANSKPDGLCISKWEDVVPPWGIVQKIKSHEMTGAEYREEYYKKLNSKPPIKYFEYLDKYSDQEAIVLLCWEKNFYDCHRGLLAYFLTYIGRPVDTLEYEPSMNL